MALDVVAEKIGGRNVFIENLRLIPADEVYRMLNRWDHMAPEEQDSMSLHKLSLEAGVSPIKLVGWLASAMYAYNIQIAKMINAVKQPDLMKAGVEFGLMPRGVKDREMQFKMAGILTEGGPLVNVNINQGKATTTEDLLKDAIDV